MREANPTLTALAGRGFKAVAFLCIAGYGGLSLLFGFFALALGGWGAALFFGSWFVIAAAFTSLRHTLRTGLLLIIGGSLIGAGFALSGIECFGGCETYTWRDALDAGLFTGFAPTVVGFSYVASGALSKAIHDSDQTSGR
jgi:hypothetical protein